MVTDADVKHVEPPEAEEEKKEDGEPEAGSQVVLVSYEKRKVAEGEWEISATVANQGKTPVQGVNALMRVLDDKGKPVATGSGSLSGKLDPGKQGTITARVSSRGSRSRSPWTCPGRTSSRSPSRPAARLRHPPLRERRKPQAARPAGGRPGTARLDGPAGSSPNTLPANLMAVPAPQTCWARRRRCRRPSRSSRSRGPFPGRMP